MKKVFKQKILFAIIALSFISGIWFSCRKVPIVYSTTSEVNIVGYIDEHLDSFSFFRQMLKETGYDGFLDAYGSYTLFLPTNSAIKTYLNSRNKDSVSQLNVDSVKDFLKFHLINDTVYTISFTDGKLPYLTMYGQYLVTGASNTNGSTYYRVNRQANIIESNLRQGNGVIHVIDNVLTPATKTLAGLVASDPAYSIFAQAMKTTGIYDSLNISAVDNTDTTKAWLTLFAEPDSVFEANGIHSYDDLKEKFSNTGNPKDPNDSLHLFVDYHIVNRANYLADIVTVTSYSTWAPLQAITVKYSNDSILLNDDVFNGVHEPGIMVARTGSDVSATNGVLHKATSLLYIKERSPFAVYWDVCQYTEIMNLPAYYGKQSYYYPWDQLPSFITAADGKSSRPQIGYVGGVGGSSPVVNYDYLELPMGSNRMAWVELKTPMLVAGTYKVWICWRTAGKSQILQVSIDSTVMQRTYNKSIYLPSGTDAVLEAQGWKHYTTSTSSNVPGYLVGTINIQTTGQHTIRFTALSGGDNYNWLDMIEFIPSEMDQQWPRFDQDGIAHYSASE